MKRSEMVEHIAAEMLDAATYHSKYSNQSEEAYYKRKAAGLLDMIEGFGMLPPTLTGTVETKETEDGGLEIKLWGWESEDEEK